MTVAAEGVRSRKKSSSSASKKKKKASSATQKAQAAYTGHLFARALAYLFEEDDASYLAVFRILWGSIMAYEALSYTFYDFGKMQGSFYNSVIQFKYYGFEWCEVPADPLVLKAVILVMFASGVFLTLGLFYRTSSVVFFCLFTYMYMLEQAMYLNHFYLVCVLSVMMIILPCNCLFSLDALFWPDRVYSPTCPKWCLIFVKLELAVVYTYAGICKINEDWLRGEPLRDWLANREHTPYIGWILVKESTAYFMSYGGLIYDLTIAELLFFRRTLPIGVALSLFFHVSNKLVFNIGIFPWMMIASTTFYFSPDWPRRVLHWARGTKFEVLKVNTFSTTKPRSLKIWEWLIVLGLLLFLVHQVFIPLRLHTYPGTVAWNEYGHQFSWRMKLRTKVCDSHGFVYNPQTHHAFDINPQEFLNRRQYKKMSSRPDMILQMAHFIRDFFDGQSAMHYNTTQSHEVYIESWCQLNGRPYQQLTDPLHNLSTEKKWDSPYDWVTEVEPLTDEHKKNYPWNFDWNYNWLKGIDRLPKNPRKDNEARGQAMKADSARKYREWITGRDPDVEFIRFGRPQ